MTYSIVTIGGKVIESGLSEAKAKAGMEAKNKEVGTSYYSIREDEKAEQGEKAPTFAEMIEAMKPADQNARTESDEPKAPEGKDGRWNDVINEGGEGYQSANW